MNSSNRVTGEVSDAINNVATFVDLQRANSELAQENLILRKLLAAQSTKSLAEISAKDSTYTLALGHVVNASFRKSKNYLTLRIDPMDSIRPGMGVISSKGVVGTVKSVSEHFATVASLLHPNLLVSGRVQSNGALATVQWDGKNPLEAELKYVPRHLEMDVGDTVRTSGFNSIYPEGFIIGHVSTSALKRENPFYLARVRLATDFTQVRTVYIIKVTDRKEKESLEEEVQDE